MLLVNSCVLAVKSNLGIMLDVLEIIIVTVKNDQSRVKMNLGIMLIS